MPQAVVELRRGSCAATGVFALADVPEGCRLFRVPSAALLSVRTTAIAGVLRKAPTIRARMRPGQRLMIDGGVSPANAASCRDAGCDVLVAASAIFGAADRAAAIRDIRGAGG